MLDGATVSPAVFFVNGCIESHKCLTRYCAPEKDKRFVRRTILIFLFCLLAMMAACKKNHDGSPVIAAVNGEDVTRAEFEQFVTTKLGEVTNNETGDALRSQMLDEYLRRRLVLADAERAGLAVAEVE